MVSAKIYIEGGGGSKDLHTRCRQGFRQVLERCGFGGRMPRLVACGSRSETIDDFRTAQDRSGPDDYVAMLVDSEEPVANVEETWGHLRMHDGWDPPTGADDEQVLLMTTCMETWIVTDRAALRAHFDEQFQESALPSLTNMELRDRHEIQNALERATRQCKNPYAKGKRSFEVMAKLNPAELRKHLPSFERCVRVLGAKL